MNRIVVTLWSLAGLAAVAAPARAQAPDGWDSPRALELIERARARRGQPRADPGLRNYRAHAEGYVYYYLDRRDADERTLVKVDQIALEVYWGAPDRTKQRIVGLRDRKTLPNRIHYHLDHLTVVQNEFDDRIRMGDGDEVRDVLHPAAPGSGAVYEYRLADSLTLRLGGAAEPIRVYEIEVRPRRLDRPALIGSVFVDRATADIVRMTFTFTPASYVDDQLDYIRVSLDNGLWEGRYWLPYEQRLEIRRQVPILDFAVGGVIRGTMRIRDYELNLNLPAGFFRGPRVVALPAAARERHTFERDIFAELNELGLSPAPDLAELREKAVAMVGQRFLSGLPRLRLHVPNASSVLRYNRAEGWYLGAGLGYGLHPTTRLEAVFGYAFGAEHLSTSASLLARPDERRVLRLRADRHALRDLGPRAGAAGALNTLAAATTGEDYLDPYYATGLTLGVDHLHGGSWRSTFEFGIERHASAGQSERFAALDDDSPFRPVRPVDDGTLYAARASLQRIGPGARGTGWGGELAVEAGRFDRRSFVRPLLRLETRRVAADHALEFRLRGSAGLVLGDAPAQRLFLIGGRGTLPGYRYRSFVGDRFALADAGAAWTLIDPWVRLRASAAVGWTGLSGTAAPAGWGAAPSDGVRASAGIGLGLIYDVIRLDLARPLGRPGKWELIFSVHPGLRDIL